MTGEDKTTWPLSLPLCFAHCLNWVGGVASSQQLQSLMHLFLLRPPAYLSVGREDRAETVVVK
jgi:hypothetical protein